MRKPLVLFDQETGETFPLPPHWKIRWQDERIDNETARMRVNAKGKEFDESNVGIWEENPDIPLLPLDHPEFGEMKSLNSKRKFTKVYQTSKPTFTKRIYGAYWMEIAYAIEMNTGIIQRRDQNGSIHHIHTIADWMRLLDVSKQTAISFLNEIREKKLVAEIRYGDSKWWIVNPHYCWNGNIIPTAFWNLFKELDKGLVTCTSQNNIKAIPTLDENDLDAKIAS